MNMIGKISGVDWGKAPSSALWWDKKCKVFCKGEQGYWWYMNSDDLRFTDDVNCRWGTDRYISKEEDLGIMNKNTFTINDLKTGMRVTDVNGTQWTVLRDTKTIGGCKDVVVSTSHGGWNRINSLILGTNSKQDSSNIVKVEEIKHICNLFVGGQWNTIWEYVEENNEYKELQEAIKAHKKSLEELEAKAQQLTNKG